MLHLQNLSKEFNGNPIFRNISWHLKKGERVGLVGENGAGKSTLMRIIAGLMEPESGSVQTLKGAVIGYLPQDAMASGETTLFAEVMASFSYLRRIEEQLRGLSAELEKAEHGADMNAELLSKFGHLEEEFRQRGGYSMESEAGRVLCGLGFTMKDRERPCSEFSGGWRMRIALAGFLLQKPHVLLLDEPTNHLDIEARNWLEEYLKEYPYSVILVSHDRFFMDQVCHRITEIWNGSLTDYHCDYSVYLKQREERVAGLREAKRRQDEEVAKIEDFISRFRYKSDKAALVQSRIKQLEKIERIVLPPERKRICFAFPPAPKSGRIALELKKVTKAYGEKVILDDVDLIVERGEKISIVGHNGAGKSTLMHVLAGSGFQRGERIVGHNVIIDYFAQNQSASLDEERTVYEELLADAPFDAVPGLRDLLGAFLFSGDEIRKRVGVLSGGEKNRLALAKMLLRPANVLLLDEPTNHLDLFSKEVLLDALKSFSGTILFVSHDRHFIDALATRVIEVDNGGITSFAGNYEDYLEKTAGRPGVADDGATPRQVSANPLKSDGNPAAKAERMLRRDEEKQRQRDERARLKKIEELENLIEKHETLLHELEQKMSDPGFFEDQDAGRRAAEDHQALSCKISCLYTEWEEAQGARAL
ncbi:MAG TPA: ABC-F family ATP-binding cassette domain-containing protein [Geobacteraceae bacterium]|nr:ABC-F family ATP-binding cassette domain-containing protein [Geobacteraceae bacterium]